MAVFNSCATCYGINRNKRLYCTFVDLTKAFDSINRNALWFKLNKLGLNGKMLRIVRAMYSSVKCSIRHGGAYSDYMDISLGLKQEEIMSPLLYSLFVEDLELSLQDNVAPGLSIDDITLILLLFADDMVIMGETREELQQNLNLLEQYCDKWGLVANMQKTKVVIFRKRGRASAEERWFYKGSELSNVDNFNYLGVTFNYTGTFALN